MSTLFTQLLFFDNLILKDLIFLIFFYCFSIFEIKNITFLSSTRQIIAIFATLKEKQKDYVVTTI